MAFVEAFFFHDGAASNQRLPIPIAEKELKDAYSVTMNIFRKILFSF